MASDNDKMAADSEGPCWRAAVEYGMDMSLVEFLMSLTPEERFDRHEQARVFVEMLRQAGRDYYGFDLHDSTEVG